MSEQPYIQLRNICKTFGSVHANRVVNLSVKKGEIHALLGENGSGKSTLVNMLSGIYAPDSGKIFVGGKQMQFASPRDAINADKRNCAKSLRGCKRQQAVMCRSRANGAKVSRPPRWGCPISGRNADANQVIARP